MGRSFASRLSIILLSVYQVSADGSWSTQSNWNPYTVISGSTSVFTLTLTATQDAISHGSVAVAFPTDLVGRSSVLSSDSFACDTLGIVGEAHLFNCTQTATVANNSATELTLTSAPLTAIYPNPSYEVDYNAYSEHGSKASTTLSFGPTAISSDSTNTLINWNVLCPSTVVGGHGNGGLLSAYQFSFTGTAPKTLSVVFTAPPEPGVPAITLSLPSFGPKCVFLDSTNTSARCTATGDNLNLGVTFAAPADIPSGVRTMIVTVELPSGTTASVPTTRYVYLNGIPSTKPAPQSFNAGITYPSYYIAPNHPFPINVSTSYAQDPHRSSVSFALTVDPFTSILSDNLGTCTPFVTSAGKTIICTIPTNSKGGSVATFTAVNSNPTPSLLSTPTTAWAHVQPIAGSSFGNSFSTTSILPANFSDGIFSLTGIPGTVLNNNTLTVLLGNAGPSHLLDTVITINLPAELEFPSAIPHSVNGFSCKRVSPRTAECSYPDKPAGIPSVDASLPVVTAAIGPSGSVVATIVEVSYASCAGFPESYRGATGACDTPVSLVTGYPTMVILP